MELVQGSLAHLREAITMQQEAKQSWQIELEDRLTGTVRIQLHVVGDTIVGRNTGDNSVDVDLTPYGGWFGGVSRRHLLLRPSRHHLHAIELGSTKGTWVNDILLSKNVAVPLAQGDILKLGDLEFTVTSIRSDVSLYPTFRRGKRCF